jgi:hypothetical protein
LHRRRFVFGSEARWSPERRADAWELLGDGFWEIDGAGDKWGSPLDFGGLEDASPDVRMGSVTLIFVGGRRMGFAEEGNFGVENRRY